nr:F-box protein At3g07870-like [Quercus suber]
MAQFDRAKSLCNNNNNDNNNGYLLHIPSFCRKEFCTAVYNSDRTLTEISRFQIPCYFGFVGYCRGMFYFVDEEEENHIIYFWNPSIRKFKKVEATPLNFHDLVLYGLAYHYQNNDYKILRIIFYPIFHQPNVKPKPAEAEIYTLSTDSWRKVVISVESSSGPKPIESVHFDSEEDSCFVFFNGALHCIARSQGHKFIMYFDVNDERFREILLPQNYLDGLSPYSQHLAVFKGLLALIVLEEKSNICHIWMMKEYGVAESWIKKSVPMKEVVRFLGFTVNGELLIQKFNPFRTLSFHPESLNEKILEIPGYKCMYTDFLVESLLLLDGI